MKISKPILLLILYIITQHAQSQVMDTSINTGAYTLRFKITEGIGTPILFESGGGLGASQWDAITTVLHQTIKAPLITYDRECFGKSSSIDTAHYNLLNEIKGLEFSLKQLGYANRHLILVCHSLGGFYARVYASRHPNQVKGMIMLDPRIPSYTDMLAARKIYNMIDRTKLRPEDFSLFYVLFKMEKNSDFARHVFIPSKVPVLDIMAEKGPFTSAKENKRFKSDQRQFVKAAANRSLLFAKGSAHNIPLDKPQLVIDQIIYFYKKHS